MPTYKILTHSSESRENNAIKNWNDRRAKPETITIDAESIGDAFNKATQLISSENRVIVSVEEKVPAPTYTREELSQILLGEDCFPGKDDYANLDFKNIVNRVRNILSEVEAQELLIALSCTLDKTIAPGVEIDDHLDKNIPHFVVNVKRAGTDLERNAIINIEELAEKGETGWDAVLYAAESILKEYYSE